MNVVHSTSSVFCKSAVRTIAAVAALAIVFAGNAMGSGKKKSRSATPTVTAPSVPKIDTSKLVWPDPPDIARIRWLQEFRGEPEHIEKAEQLKPKKKGWMDRLAGIQPTNQNSAALRFKLVRPYGVATDSAGNIYTADSYVGAIFIFNPETGKVDFIRNGREARFKDIIGLAIDDDDRLFVTDSDLQQVFVFSKEHKLLTTFGIDALRRPTGIAIDTRNRLVYVADVAKNCVVQFDADTLKMRKTIGGPPPVPGQETPGTFARPTNVAVDRSGQIYVSDTINSRIQIFDLDGNFLKGWGTAGDGPTALARPKGIAIDGDGHVWVVDADQNRVKVFDRDGHLLAFLGEYGYLPGQFALPTGLAIDKWNRVIVSEQTLHARLQVLRYVPDKDAEAQKREEQQRAQVAESSGNAPR